MSTLAGPFSEISNFLNFIHKRGNYSKIPFSIWHPFKVFILGFIFLGSNVLLNKYGFHPLKALDDEFYYTSYFWKIIWLDIAVFNIWFKYYAVWVKQNAIVSAAGYSFNGYNEEGKAKWDWVMAVDVNQVEFGTNFRVVMDVSNFYFRIGIRHVLCGFDDMYTIDLLIQIILKRIQTKQCIWHLWQVLFGMDFTLLTILHF